MKVVGARPGHAAAGDLCECVVVASLAAAALRLGKLDSVASKGPTRGLRGCQLPTAAQAVRAARRLTPHLPLALQFAKLRHLGCSFLVAGRCDSEGRFLTLADLEVPEVLPRGVGTAALAAAAPAAVPALWFGGGGSPHAPPAVPRARRLHDISPPVSAPAG